MDKDTGIGFLVITRCEALLVYRGRTDYIHISRAESMYIGYTQRLSADRQILEKLLLVAIQSQSDFQFKGIVALSCTRRRVPVPLASRVSCLRMFVR